MDLKLSSGASVRLIGDPHLGKSFEAGVSLERRGEREAAQMKQFMTELFDPGFDYIIVMGDLFEHPYVSFEIVLDTYKAVSNAAATNKSTQYIVIAGNHDVPRNVQAVGAFHVFERLCYMRADNLSILSHAAQVGPIACYPWVWETAAKDQEIIAPVDHQKVELVVGHWDLKLFGENDKHMCPSKLLTKRHPKAPIYTGHYHVPGVYNVDGIDIICTGSMQPYSHGEDPNGEKYVTFTTDELGEIDTDTLKDKCVRVLLLPGEELPQIDCLQLTPKRISKQDEEEAIEIARGGFKWSDILHAKMKNVPPPVQEFIHDRLRPE